MTVSKYQAGILEKMKTNRSLIETPEGYKLRQFVAFDTKGQEVWRYEHIPRRTVTAMIKAGLIWYEEPEDEKNKHLTCA